jgi:sugar phosphate isomerase/epimerase
MTNRRQFILGSAALARGLTAAGGGFEIGCFTRPWAGYDYRVAFDGIAEAGYKCVGLMSGLGSSGKPGTLITVETTPEQAGVIGGEAAKRGLKVISMWGGEFSLKSSEAGIEGLKRLIDNCAACHCSGLLLGGVGKQDLFEAYYQVVAGCCDYAKSKGITLGVKPHGGLNSTGPECRKIVERVGHKNFGIWYDPGNIFFYSDGKLDPVDDVLSVSGLVVGMCVKDFKMPKDVNVTPGTGMVNFPEVFARLKKGGFKRGPLVVECVDKGDAAQSTAEARKARVFVEKLAA